MLQIEELSYLKKHHELVYKNCKILLLLQLSVYLLQSDIQTVCHV